MEGKVCVVCNTEKSIDNFHNKYKECKQCNFKRSSKRYYENKDEISNQQKFYYEKNRDKLLQKQNSRYINFEEIRRSHVELQNRLKAMEEKITINDLNNNKDFGRNDCKFFFQ